MKNKKIKLSIQLRDNENCFITFEGNFDDSGENIVVEVPQVFEALFETLQTEEQLIGYLEKIESEHALNLDI